MKKINNTTLSAVAISLLASATVSQAATLAVGETIGIDFGTIAPTASANFNQYDAFNNSIADGASAHIGTGAGGLGSVLGGGAATELITTTNVVVSDVAFTVTNESGQNTSRANVTNGTSGPAPFNDSTIYQDSIISNNQGGAALDPGGYLVFTFSGLDDNLIYKLTGGYDGANSNFDSTWSFDSGSAGISMTENDAISSFLSSPGATTGYQTRTGLRTDGSGNLVIQVSRNTLHVNAGGLTLTAIPEPSSALLLGAIGMFAMVHHRRRRA